MTSRSFSNKPKSLNINRPEADVPPEVIWGRSVRSAFYGVTEFYLSQCISRFAASFIATRAEASRAKNYDKPHFENLRQPLLSKKMQEC